MVLLVTPVFRVYKVILDFLAILVPVALLEKEHLP
jgi:hypothetical protein